MYAYLNIFMYDQIILFYIYFILSLFYSLENLNI